MLAENWPEIKPSESDFLSFQMLGSFLVAILPSQGAKDHYVRPLPSPSPQSYRKILYRRARDSRHRAHTYWFEKMVE